MMEIIRNLDDFITGFYCSAVDCLNDAVDRLTTLDYFSPPKEDINRYFERVPRNLAGISGSIAGGLLDITLISAAGYSMIKGFSDLVNSL